MTTLGCEGADLIRRFLTSLLLCTLITSCAHNKSHKTDEPPKATKVDEREIALGEAIHQQIVSSFRIYTEPRVVGYISKVGKAIAVTAKRKDLNYQFTVLYDDRVYSTHAPGGFVYVTTGALDFLQNESELAGFLSQEIAYLQFKDPRNSNSKGTITRLAQTGAMIGPMFGQIGALAATALAILDAISTSAELTQEEQLAKVDHLALQYMVKTGQDPQGYLDLLERLSRPEWKESPFLYDYLSTRPVGIERYKLALKEFGKLEMADKSFSTGRERYLDVTKGVREIYH